MHNFIIFSSECVVQLDPDHKQGVLIVTSMVAE